MKQEFKLKESADILVCRILIFFLIILITPLSAQVSGSTEKRIRIGSLHSHFTAYGAERAWNDSYYAGMDWPADYPLQDNAVIERAWLASEDFTDADQTYWEKYAIYISSGYVSDLLFPVEHVSIAKFDIPTVYVDGADNSTDYKKDIDSIDVDQIPDRIISNVVNTAMGLTMSRRIYAFSQQYHDNYFIKEYTYTNTGNVDYDDDIELNDSLKGVRVSWGIRYSVSRDGAPKFDNQQSWGKYTWVTRRGEDYPAHATESITEDNPIVDWIRCAFAWSGQSDRNADFDNIGAPDLAGTGRLAAPQHAGTAVLHVDRSATDSTDNPNQPTALGWHAGDTYPNIPPNNIKDLVVRKAIYNMVSGNPHGGSANGGSNRFYEDNTTSIIHQVSPWTLHSDEGGTNTWVCYGPFDLAPGESIQIVEAEAVSGLSREMCEEIGIRWKKAYDDDSDNGPFDLPGGGSTTDKDIFKNTWVYTGVDSILQTFGRAIRNYRSGYNIPQPPAPPQWFDVASGGDRITLSWAPSPSAVEADFAGYKIYRAVGKPDTTYQMVYDGEPGINLYEDKSATRGFSYYYYIVAYNDGSNNTTGATNPTGSLHSNRFYARTNQPAFLKRQARESFDKIRIVPNPYHVSARDQQFPGEPDKIMFYDIPKFCDIRIYTERGDLINTIHHIDGSGDEGWNSITNSRQLVVSGIYIAHFEVTEDIVASSTGKTIFKKGDSAFRKFIIIR